MEIRKRQYHLMMVGLVISLFVVSGLFVVQGSFIQAADITGNNDVFLPIVSKTDVTQLRPYTNDSYWNIPIAPNPQYDSRSGQMINTLAFNADGRILSDPSQYTFPVYFVDGTTPRWDVPCLVYKCRIITPGGSYTVPVLRDVPIPPAVQPSHGSDAQIIVIDRDTLTEYDFWRVKRTANGWTVSNGTVYNISWNGTPPKYNSRGAGVPYYAGLIRPWEIEQGRIDHALAFGYPQTAADRCVYPATKTDGDSAHSYAIPEGARLQLDPSLTEADFNQMGLNRTGKIIARALQEYGMVLIDTSGQAKIYVEDLENNPYSTVQWSDPGLDLTHKTIAAIPHTAFRVLALPSVYWNEGAGSGFHGDCYTYP